MMKKTNLDEMQEQKALKNRTYRILAWILGTCRHNLYTNCYREQ